jgi:hypothetical protein
MIRIVFFDTMTDFAKFIAQKELVHLLKLTIHTSSYYSAEDVCIRQGPSGTMRGYLNI